MHSLTHLEMKSVVILQSMSSVKRGHAIVTILANKTPWKLVISCRFIVVAYTYRRPERLSCRVKPLLSGRLVVYQWKCISLRDSYTLENKQAVCWRQISWGCSRWRWSEQLVLDFHPQCRNVSHKLDKKEAGRSKACRRWCLRSWLGVWGVFYYGNYHETLQHSSVYHTGFIQ